MSSPTYRPDRDTQTARPPVFSKVIVASIVAAVTPVLTRWLADQLGLLVDEEDARRALVTAVTLVTTFAAGFLKSEPVANVQRYLAAKRA